MIQDRDTDTQRTPRKSKRDFFEGLLFTAIPFVVLVVTIASMAGRGGELVWMLGLWLCVFAALASGGFAIVAKPRIALGILAGTAIGIVGLVVSCSTVLATPGTPP